MMISEKNGKKTVGKGENTVITLFPTFFFFFKQGFFFRVVKSRYCFVKGLH